MESIIIIIIIISTFIIYVVTKMRWGVFVVSLLDTHYFLCTVRELSLYMYMQTDGWRRKY
jgi:hypothetical protein